MLSYEQPQKYIVETENYSETFSTPVLTAGKSFILGYTNETTGVYNGKESPVIIFDDFTGDKKYVDFDFKVKSSAMKLLHKVNTSDNLKYLFYALQSIKYTPFSHKRIWISEYSNFLIEYRHPQEQNAIVLALDGINQAIYNKKQELFSLDELVKSRFIEMFGDPILNEKNWEIQSISNVCEKILGGGTPSKKHPEFYIGSIPWVTPKDMKTSTICDSIDHINEMAIENSTTNLISQSSVLMVIRSGILKHTLPVAINSTPVTINQDMKAFILGDKILPEFLLYCFKAMESDILGKVRCVTADNIDFKDFLNRQIIIPPIELQNEFAEFVKLIDKSKFIVQQQIKDLQELVDSKMDEYFR